jgi:hypothetical protein
MLTVCSSTCRPSRTIDDGHQVCAARQIRSRRIAERPDLPPTVVPQCCSQGQNSIIRGRFRSHRSLSLRHGERAALRAVVLAPRLSSSRPLPHDALGIVGDLATVGH